MNLWFIFICACLSVASGIKYDGLRVKVGWSDALKDQEYFFDIPRTITEAEAGGWTRTGRPPGPLPELKMFCPPSDRSVCPLYDTSGFVAGLQLALPVDDFESLAIKPEKKMVKWRAPTAEGEPVQEYWTATQYYVSEESLKSGTGPQIENGETLQDGAVWVKGLDGLLLRIPATEVELNSTAFKKQNCIPNMGTHYYYNMTRAMKCENLLPWFALVSQGDLVGTGFQMIGQLALPIIGKRDWFERPPAPKQSVQITIPFAPSCLHDWTSAYGVVSLHIYYIDKPWKIRCQTGDSVKPASVMDRVMLTGYRYANKIADEFKKLFTG